MGGVCGQVVCRVVHRSLLGLLFASLLLLAKAPRDIAIGLAFAKERANVVVVARVELALVRPPQELREHHTCCGVWEVLGRGSNGSNI